MAHFARLGIGNIVKKVHVVNNNTATDEQTGIDFLQTLHKTDDKFVQTSYNNNFRKQYAGINYFYDEVNNVFIKPKPFDSWSLDSNFDWQPPTAYPEHNDENKPYVWNERTKIWEEWIK